MKKAMPCVMSSKAVTISPDATSQEHRLPLVAEQVVRPHRPGDHELDRQRRPGPVLHEQGSAGDERGHEVPGAGDEDEHQSVGNEIEPPPEPVLVQQRVNRTVPQAHPEDLGHHVDEDEHAGEQDDDRVEGHVDGSTGDRDDRKRDEEVGVLAAPPTTEQVEQTGEPQRIEEGRPSVHRWRTRGRVEKGREDVDDEEQRADHDERNAGDEDCPRHRAELAEVRRQRPVQGVKRRIVGDEAVQPEDGHAAGDQAPRPRRQPVAPQRLLEQERHQEQERPEDDQVGGPEDPHQWVRGQNTEVLLGIDELDRLHLVDPHEHAFDGGEAVVDQPDDDKAQGQLLHRRERAGIELALVPVDQRCREAHGPSPHFSQPVT